MGRMLLVLRPRDPQPLSSNLGLDRYVPAFGDNDIDAEVLPKTNRRRPDQHRGTSVDHRRKLLDAIASLGMAVPAAVVTAPAPGAPAQVVAEGRQLTVMFWDLVGSTALSTRHDPEDLRELIGTTTARSAFEDRGSRLIPGPNQSGVW